MQSHDEANPPALLEFDGQVAQFLPSVEYWPAEHGTAHLPALHPRPVSQSLLTVQAPPKGDLRGGIGRGRAARRGDALVV
jgi:hypothetical protein